MWKVGFDWPPGKAPHVYMTSVIARQVVCHPRAQRRQPFRQFVRGLGTGVVQLLLAAGVILSFSSAPEHHFACKSDILDQRPRLATS